MTTQFRSKKTREYNNNSITFYNKANITRYKTDKGVRGGAVG